MLGPCKTNSTECTALSLYYTVGSKETKISNLKNIVALKNLSTTQDDDTVVFHRKNSTVIILLNYSSETCMANTNIIFYSSFSDLPTALYNNSIINCNIHVYIALCMYNIILSTEQCRYT